MHDLHSPRAKAAVRCPAEGSRSLRQISKLSYGADLKLSPLGVRQMP